MELLQDPAFWVAASLGTFLIILIILKVPGMALKALDGRANAIKTEIDEARRLRDEAQTLLAEQQRQQAQAKTQADQIIAEAHAAIKAEADKQRAAVDAELAKTVEAAEAQIADAKKRAIAGVRAVAIEVAGAIVEKVLHERPSALDLSRVVDDELRAA